MNELLTRIVAESDAARARWARWGPEVFAGLPPWATRIANARVSVVVTLDVPAHVDHDRMLVIHHEDTGHTERRLVHERTLTDIHDEGGWVARLLLGADPRTDAGRPVIAALRQLEATGLVERDTRHWWRPTPAGREAVGK